MRKVFGGLALTVVLFCPLAMRADDHDKRVTYYDEERHDRHEWNEQEERAYRHWIEEERHQKYRDFKHASKQQQREYWEWRHAHSDWR